MSQSGEPQGTGEWDPPRVYLDMYDAGLVDPSHDQQLLLSDLRWLAIGELREGDVGAVRQAGAVTFAKDGRGDSWAWNPLWRTKQERGVGFYPHDLAIVRGYAPNFVGCIYRLLLEEFSSSWLADTADLDASHLPKLFRSYVQRCRTYLPEDWSSTLDAVVARDLIRADDGTYSLIDPREADQIIRRDLAFPQLTV